MSNTFLCLLLAITMFSTSVMADDVDRMLDGLEHSLLSDPSKALGEINELAAPDIQLSNHQQARFKTLKSIKLLFDGNYLLALDILSEAEGLTSSASLLNSIYLYQATAYMSLKNYKLGLDSISKNLSKIESLDGGVNLSDTYQRLANLYLALEAYDETLFYASKTLDLSSGVNKKNRCYSLLLISVTNLKLDKLSESKSKFTETKIFCENNNFPLVSAMSIKGLGLIELKLGNFINAKEYLLRSLSIYEVFQYQLEINNVYALLAETYLGLKQPLKAKEYASFVISLPNETKNLEFKEIAMKVMSELSYQAGDYKQAYDYFVLHQDLSNTLLDDTKAKANAYQMAKFENGEKTREIHLLNKDRELYTAKAELTELQRNNERMMFLLICGSFIVLTLFAINMTLQKRKYKNLAQFDVLTGIYNRGTGQDKAENRYVKDSISGVNFSVILFDLDHFKNINDSYGHAMGDWVLKKVCEVVSIECRSGDIFTRFGGEEFALFMSNTDNDTAKKVAEKCRAQILAIETRYSGHEFTISASFGVATSTVKDLSLDPIIQRADVAMYQSKEHGRDRVSVYSSEVT